MTLCPPPGYCVSRCLFGYHRNRGGNLRKWCRRAGCGHDDRVEGMIHRGLLLSRLLGRPHDGKPENRHQQLQAKRCKRLFSMSLHRHLWLPEVSRRRIRQERCVVVDHPVSFFVLLPPVCYIREGDLVCEPISWGRVSFLGRGRPALLFFSRLRYSSTSLQSEPLNSKRMGRMARQTTGLPSLFAGWKRDSLTALMASSSKPDPAVSTASTAMVLPLSSMVTVTGPRWLPFPVAWPVAGIWGKLL